MKFVIGYAWFQDGGLLKSNKSCNYWFKHNGMIVYTPVYLSSLLLALRSNVSSILPKCQLHRYILRNKTENQVSGCVLVFAFAKTRPQCDLKMASTWWVFFSIKCTCVSTPMGSYDKQNIMQKRQLRRNKQTRN